MQRSISWVVMTAAFALAACNSNIEQNSGSSTQPLDRGGVTASDELVQPVVIGESGPRFDACQATGFVRSVSGDGALPVRAAPLGDAEQRDTLANGDAVFVCNRSHDQTWLGVIYNAERELGEECGVSTPIASQRRYDGPCRSGWVASAFVQLRSVGRR